jgi:hypothetical protein
MAATVNIYAELQQLIVNISQRNMYSGNKMPDSVMKQFEIVVDEKHIGILVPYWLPVFQKGRGPRRQNKDFGLVKIIYAWMQKRNMFRSTTPKGKFNEARFLTWWINKYGNAHFRSKVFVDIYESERKKTIEKINEKYSKYISEITMQVI